MAEIVYSTFPKTERPTEFSIRVADLFARRLSHISTVELEKGFESDYILQFLRPELEEMGFMVEKGKKRDDKIYRPVFFGENGAPTVNYQIDAFHNEWKCGLEIEAGRAWMGNAIYRNLIQSLVMVELDHLILAVPQTYKYHANGRPLTSKDYQNTRNLLETLFSHTRFRLPYNVTLIGY